MASTSTLLVLRHMKNKAKTLPSSRWISTTLLNNGPGEGQESLAKQAERNEEVGSYTELVRDFLDPAEFHAAVRKNGIGFFTGVPDSLLKDYCAYVTANESREKHVIAANEGSAVALASGYHFATGKTGMVYLQNSGLGNIVNPILSMATPSVYSVPMLLLVGWRGEPGKRDEPQHTTKGQATPGILAACGIPFQVLPDYLQGAEQVLYSARKHMEVSKGPYCLLVKRQTFYPYKYNAEPTSFDELPLRREEAVEATIRCLHDRDVVIGTTGMLSRELFELREKYFQGHEKDFLTVGSMGHASAIALGVAINKPRRQVFCLDGDGAAIMHLGNMSTVGSQATTNYNHIVINNGAHDSVGGQPTDAINSSFDVCKIAMGLGYKSATVATTEEEIKQAVVNMRTTLGPNLLEIRVRKGGRKNLGRPTRTPVQNKNDFMHFLAID